jgi:hypothetical protein
MREQASWGPRAALSELRTLVSMKEHDFEVLKNRPKDTCVSNKLR